MRREADMRPVNVIGVAGAGAWGVALANAAAAAGRTVILWGRDEAGMRAERDAGDPVRPKLCRRRGARAADRGDARVGR